MKFTDYKYEHMDIEALQAQLKAICSKLQNAASYAEFKNAFIELNDVNKYINTNQTLVDVRHTVDTRDEYEETLELEELKERALEESSKLQIGEQAIAEKITYIENMEQEEAELLKQVQQIRLKRGKEKLKLISNGENILISFEEWRALKEQILAKAKNNNIGGLISWKEYRYNPYGNYTELDEYVIRLQNQLLHIYEYENQIQANLEQLTEERKEMLERKAQEDSKEDEMIGWKKILGNQYSLEESFDIEAVLENNSKVLSHFEQILKETVNSQKVGKGTRESVQIILDNMQNSQEERE